MSDETTDLESLHRELNYYKRQLDKLSGDILKLDLTISGLRHELRQKRQGFALLSELQEAISTRQEASSIFEITIQSINANLGMDKTLVLSATDRENYYRPRQWVGFHGDAAANLTSMAIEFPSDFAKGNGLLLVNKASEKTPLVEKIQSAFDLPYFLCLPVKGEDAPLGLLLSGRLKEAKPLYPPLDQGDVDTFRSIGSLITALVRRMRVAVLEEMDRLKTEFFANISHEFRTPITLTVGPLEQILKGHYGMLPDAVRDQLLIMERNQERLLRLVNQILDLTKLEAGSMRLKAAPVLDMNQFVRERLEEFRSFAEERGLQLKTSLDPRVRGTDLFVDLEMFDKLLFNLLSNAIKFTNKGHVETITEIRNDGFFMTIRDTGIGIKQDQLPHVFDRFRQADGSEARGYAGTGIGLALVKEIASLHGGGVQVHSEYGEGSSFEVLIPLGKDHLGPASVVEFAKEDVAKAGGAKRVIIVDEGGTRDEGAEQINQETEATFDSAKPTVLYVEDNADLRKHVRNLLVAQYNVFLAIDGHDGLEKARKYTPDLILTDQMMPHMSGRGLLRALRKDPELRSIPVIFVTALSGTESRVETLDAGADDYLSKPFDEDELFARLRNLLRAREQEKELAKLNRQLEAKIDEQMAELMRSGELKRFLPEAIVESVLNGRIGPEDTFERCKVTALFADLVGFTTLTDRLEPEEIAPLINDYVSEMTAAAVAHGGTIEKFIGDAIAVTFGAPKKTEVRVQVLAALEAAFEMQMRVERLSVLWRRRGLSGDLALRIGLNTGYCTVGVFGSELFKNYAALGTPINVAARLQAEAPAGGILCGYQTYVVAQDRVKAQPRGALTLRNVSHPIEAYEILELLEEEKAEAVLDQDTAD